MKSWPAKALLLTSALVALAAIPALGQENPESLLPPGFNDPQTLPPPEKATPTPRSPQPQTGPAMPASPGTPGNASEATDGNLIDLEEVALDQMLGPRPSNYFTVPQGSERPVDRVGMIGPGSLGLEPNAFGPNFGGRSAALMRALDAPLPSRWASILLRRALLSRLDAPAGINPVDFVAERAGLLLRMGEADAARMLVQGVDVENYTPRMIEVAGQTALANADPAALCPLVGPARSRSNDVVWILSDGMCAALEGEAARATALIDQARGQAGTSIDLLLAEKVVGSGEQSRRGVEVEWTGVDRINAWRFGLASATGVEIPERLRNGMPPQITAWMARAPMLPLEQRLQAGAVAAELGVFSSTSLVELHSLMLDQLGEADSGGTVGARLRTAWAGRSVDERMTALRALWTGEEARAGPYARSILTAGAAARIPASSDLAADAGNLVASMLSAGMDRQAGRWGATIEQGGEGDRAWALLAVGGPQGAVTVDSSRIGDFAGADDSPGQMRSQLFVAGLAGLGRISADQASSAGLSLGPDDPWTRAIDQAVRERRPGVVALLAGIGMQTRDWTGVPPAYLYRIVRSLRAVGLEFEARMIAAEAVARL
ncbi:MAG TPA: hypothetical protein VLK25_01955 [Allosphingosinicella sp.]|nr:hypothetical protein [Allosphingosinicella sp.]